jgi:hypothetical protein
MGTRLIPKGHPIKQNKPYGKSRTAVEMSPMIKPDPPLPQNGVAVVASQALRHGKSRMIAVEFAALGAFAGSPSQAGEEAEIIRPDAEVCQPTGWFVRPIALSF